MASINDLDNPLLLLILNRLCIQKLFTAGHVCVRWNAIRGFSARDRKELVLMIGNNAKLYIEKSGFQIPKRRELKDENGDAMFPDQSDVQLKIHSFPLEFVRLLLTNFTSLTSLTISSRVYSKEIDSIIHLLEQFNRPNGTLHTLKLYSDYYQKDRITELDKNHIRNIRTYLRLLSAVNSIGSLRKLTFDVNAKFVKNLNYPRIDLSILAQLEQFEFNSTDEFYCLHDSITRYAVNNQGLRRIGIHYLTDDFTWMLDLSAEFASRFTHLHLAIRDYNFARFENLCRHFVHLTSLEIDFHQDIFAISFLVRPLTHLPNLLALTVFISGEILDNSTVPPNERGTVRLELPSVKVFTIHISTRTNNHNFFHECNLNRVFPNVQVVRVIRVQSPCWKCYSNIDEWTQLFRLQPEDAIAIEQHCALYMFKHFTNAQHLRIVLTEDADDSTRDFRCMEWIWNELKPFEDEDEEEEEEEE